MAIFFKLIVFVGFSAWAVSQGVLFYDVVVDGPFLSIAPLWEKIIVCLGWPMIVSFIYVFVLSVVFRAGTKGQG